MKGFALDEKGDVVIEKDDIRMISDTELLIQKIRQVLSTNRGEWWLDAKEGIPVQKILKKNPDHAKIKDCVRSAVSQVDAGLRMISCEITTEGRSLKISFSVTSEKGTINTEMEV